jgi:hypothetical protein
MKRAVKEIVSILGLVAASAGAGNALGAEPAIAAVAAGPQWWPGAGTVNFATPEAACNSTPFQQAFLGSATFLFDHVGPRNEGDRRNWCWFVIVDNDTVPRFITVVSPVCPAGSQVAVTAKPKRDEYRCLCNNGLTYDVQAKQCLPALQDKGKANKKK